MRSKKARLHPLLIILAVALASVLFVAACGGGAEPTAAPADSQAAAAEAAAAIAAAEAATAKAIADAEAQAVASAAELASITEIYELAAEKALQVAEEAEVEAAAAALLATEGAPQYGGTLRVTMAPDFTGLDPLFLVGGVGLTLHQQAYDNLLMIQPDLSVKPELATSWVPNDDFSSFTFNLRKGVKFHHGKEFKAEDVVFTINRWIDPVIDSSIRSTFNIIEEMVVIDDYTIRFDLDAPNAFFPGYLSIFQARILPSDVDVARFANEEFGTGPFIMVEHLVNERTTFERNPDYWDEGLPYLDELVILSIPEVATRAAALTSGDVDVIYEVAPQSVPAIEAHPDTSVLNTASFSWMAMTIPTDVPPFDNLLVRKAMQAATDREAINQASLLGLGTVARDHQFHPGHPSFAPQHAPPDYDVELAKSLLEQAGYPDGIDITLYTGEIAPGMLSMALSFKESAEPAGIRVDVVKVPSDGFWEDYWNQGPGVGNLATVRWFGRLPDQALTIQSLSDAKWNSPQFKSARLDELVVKARGQDLAGQKESYAEVQQILIDNVPRIITTFTPWMYGVRNDVRGVAPHPLSWPIFQEGWFVAD